MNRLEFLEELVTFGRLSVCSCEKRWVEDCDANAKICGKGFSRCFGKWEGDDDLEGEV